MGDFIARLAADPAVSAIVTAIIAAAIALWLLAAMWAHADTERRTGSQLAALAGAGWILLSTPLLLPLSLAVYAMVRPADAVGDRRVRELTAAMIADSLAAASCTACGTLVDASWRRCPSCADWLAAPCADCGRWSDVDLQACPWCGDADRAEPLVENDPMDRRPFLPSLPGLVGVMGLVPVEHGGPMAPSRPAVIGALRPGRTAEATAAGRTRTSPSRPWQRRAPVAHRARSSERATSEGQSRARVRG